MSTRGTSAVLVAGLIAVGAFQAACDLAATSSPDEPTAISAPGSLTKDEHGETALDIRCSAKACSEHGKCKTGPHGAARCACDDGFGGAGCAVKTAVYGRRVKIAEDLADPVVYKFDDDHFAVTGTGGAGFSFYESSDLVSWTKTKRYDPNEKDPNAGYCWMWAPDLVRDQGQLWLYFSAYRGPKGSTSCPPPPGWDIATYRAASLDGSLDFGKPEPLFPGTTGARTYPQAGCPPQGCSRAIRIDPTLYDDRLYYVYFANGGNNIASVSMTNNLDVRIHAGVDAFPTNPFEERINEAPELLDRDGRKYLFFSAGFFDSQYATFYVMGSSTDELTRDRPLLRLTTPVRRKNGNLIETHGHNSIVTQRGETFNIFHLGNFDDRGRLTRRDTYTQRLTWNADGTAMSQNEVTVAWNRLGDANEYSFDVVLRDGTVLGPCINAATIGRRTSVAFTGICPDANDRLVHRANVSEFRIYTSTGGPWVQVGSTAYDGFSDRVNLTLRP